MSHESSQLFSAPLSLIPLQCVVLSSLPAFASRCHMLLKSYLSHARLLPAVVGWQLLPSGSATHSSLFTFLKCVCVFTLELQLPYKGCHTESSHGSGTPAFVQCLEYLERRFGGLPRPCQLICSSGCFAPWPTALWGLIPRREGRAGTSGQSVEWGQGAGCTKWRSVSQWSMSWAQKTQKAWRVSCNNNGKIPGKKVCYIFKNSRVIAFGIAILFSNWICNSA